MSFPRSRTPWSLLLPLVLSFAVAGCASSSGAKSDTGTANRTLVGSFESVPAGIDPADRANLHHFAFSPVLAQLVLFAPGKGDKYAAVSDVLPDLAESWKRESNGSFTFKLRKTTSSAGNPLKAVDVKWSIERSIELNNISKTVWNSVGGDPKEPVTVVDDNTVRLNSVTGNESLLGAAALFEFGVIDSVTALAHATKEDPWAAEWMRTNLPSYGAYTLEKFVPETEISYKANPAYWNASKLYYKRVVNRAVSDASTLVSLIQAGQLDFGMPVPFASLPTLKKVPGIKLDTSPTLLMTQLNLDLRTGPFAKAEVRRAVSMAIDRKVLNEGAYAGIGSPATGVATRALSGATEASGAFVHAPEAARAELAEAGYPNGFAFTLSYSAQSLYAAEQSAVAQLLQQQLAKVGITMKINPVATPAEYSKGSADRAYEASVGTQGPLLPDLQYLIGLRWAGEESLISPGFRNAELIRLNKAAVAASGEDRAKLLNEMLVIANEEIPVIPLVDLPNQWALKAGVEGAFVNGGQTIYPHLMHGK